MLAVEGGEPCATPVHHLLRDGSFAVTVPHDGMASAMVLAAGASGVQAVLELTDYAPLPLREPVRSLVWIRGRLQQVPSAEVPELLDLIAADDPNPALLSVETSACRNSDDAPLTLLRLEIESVVVADSTGAEAVGVSTLLAARPDPFCAMDRAGCNTSTPIIRISSSGWPPGCPPRCDAATSARWAWTATGCGCASRTTKATTMSGCPSPSPSTTSPDCRRPSGC